MVAFVNPGIGAIVAIQNARRLMEEEETHPTRPISLEAEISALSTACKTMKILAIAGLATMIGISALGYYRYRALDRKLHPVATSRIEQSIPKVNSYIGVRYIPSQDRTGILNLDEPR